MIEAAFEHRQQRRQIGRLVEMVESARRSAMIAVSASIPVLMTAQISSGCSRRKRGIRSTPETLPPSSTSISATAAAGSLIRDPAAPQQRPRQCQRIAP